MAADNGRNVLAFIIVLVLELISGLCFNVFIISAIFTDYKRQKIMSSSNKIILCLNIWNVIYAVLVSVALLDQILCLPASSMFDVDFSSIYTIFLLYSISFCAWCSAGLTAFYLIKISQVGLLTWVKFRINSIVPWMLLVLEVVSFINGFVSSLLINPPWVSSRNITDGPPCVTEVLAENKLGLINAALASTCLPFIIVFFCTIVTLLTLKRHSQKMAKNMESGNSGRLTSYERVVQRITYILSFFVVFFVLMLIFYFSIISRINLGFMETLLLLCTFPSTQSVLLILFNPRFKNTWKEMLHSYKSMCGRNQA